MSKVSSNLFFLLDYFNELRDLGDLIDLCIDQFDSPNPRKDTRVLLLLSLYQQQFKYVCDEATKLTLSTYRQSKGESTSEAEDSVNS